LQTWNGQNFVVADGSAQNRIFLPFLQVNSGAATYVVGADNNGVWSYYSPNLSPNLSGGSSGKVPWQISTNVTGFTAVGAVGQLLSSNGIAAPTWLNQSSITAGTATTATNIASGVAGAVPYQTAPSTTGFTAAGTSGQVLLSNGASAPTWSTNIAGQAGSVADGSVTPAKLSTGGPYWDASGNVGIGTSSPSADIEIVNATKSLKLDANYGGTGNPYIDSTGSTNGLLIGTSDAKSVSCYTNNTLRLSVDSSGVIDTQVNPITNCPTTAKAWGGASSAGVIDAEEFNVSTITRSGLGNYLVTTAQPIVGHQIVVTPKSATGNQATAVAFSTTQFRVYTYGGAGLAADCAFQFVVFGD
jgi:hypothetical protein